MADPGSSGPLVQLLSGAFWTPAARWCRRKGQWVGPPRPCVCIQVQVIATSALMPGSQLQPRPQHQLLGTPQGPDPLNGGCLLQEAFSQSGRVGGMSEASDDADEMLARAAAAKEVSSAQGLGWDTASCRAVSCTDTWPGRCLAPMSGLERGINGLSCFSCRMADVRSDAEGPHKRPAQGMRSLPSASR